MDYISTSHALARELLNKPDGLITANIQGEEYLLESMKRTSTYANLDDSIPYWTINLRYCGSGNIKKIRKR